MKLFLKRHSDQRLRGGEVVFGLARKAHDKIARHGRLGHNLANAGHHLAIFLHRVTAFHAAEHRVRAALRRHMQIGRHLGQVAHRLEQVVGHVARIIGHELEPIEPRDIAERHEQVGQSPQATAARVAIAVDGLAQERDLAAAFGGELLRFGDDRLGRPALLGSAHRRHDAIGTEFVATDHDPHEGLEWARPHRRIAERIVTLEALLDHVASAGLAIKTHFKLFARSGLVRAINSAV